MKIHRTMNVYKTKTKTKNRSTFPGRNETNSKSRFDSIMRVHHYMIFSKNNVLLVCNKITPPVVILPLLPFASFVIVIVDTLHVYRLSIYLNSPVPGKLEWNFKYVSFKWNLESDGWGISCEIALIWMSLDITDDQSTLVQVMAPTTSEWSTILLPSKACALY